jgi:hypothetical protein
MGCLEVVKTKSVTELVNFSTSFVLVNKFLDFIKITVDTELDLIFHILVIF